MLTSTIPRFWRNAQELGHERLKLLTVVTFGHVVVHWYQQLFSLVSPELKASLDLSNVEVGTLNTARQVANGLTLPSGYLADSYRQHTGLILAAAILSFGVGYFVMGTASTYGWMLVATSMVGFGSALWHPAAIGSLSVRFRERRGMALSVHGAGASVGDSVVPILVGAVLLVMHWQLALQLHLLPAVLVAVVVWWSLRRMHQEESTKPNFGSYLHGIKEMLTNRQVIGVASSNTVSSMARLAVTAFFPLYVTETLGYSSFVLGIYLALLYVMGLISQPIMGVVSDRRGRKVVLVTSFATMTVLFALMAIATSGVMLGIVVAALGCFFYGTVNVTSAAIMDVTPDHIQSSTMGVTSLVSQPFTLLSPILTGFLTEEYGLVATFWYAAILQGVATLLLLPISFRQPARERPEGH